jgi:hypothetical protein
VKASDAYFVAENQITDAPPETAAAGTPAGRWSIHDDRPLLKSDRALPFLQAG